MQTFLKLGLSILFLYMGISLQAQDNNHLRFLSESVREASVSFGYTYDIRKDNRSMTGQGCAMMQGSAFRIEADGLHVICDGVVRWTTDMVAKEAVVENIDESEADYMVNPLVLVRDVDSVFSVVATQKEQFHGMLADKVVLSPKVQKEFDRVILYFVADSLVGVVADSAAGFRSEFVITGFTVSSKKELSSFRFDDSSLDSNWIVTDLR